MVVVLATARLCNPFCTTQVLWGECISGALYIKDFMALAKAAGFSDPRQLQVRPHSPTPRQLLLRSQSPESQQLQLLMESIICEVAPQSPPGREIGRQAYSPCLPVTGKLVWLHAHGPPPEP